MTNAEKLRAFQRAVGEDVPTAPQIPTAGRLHLRATLIREEFQEVQEEIAALTARLPDTQPSDLAPLAHELADLLYVTYGTFAALGIDADAVFAEVHRANMEKAGGPRRADGKVLKPQGWQPADVIGVLEGQFGD